MESLIAPLMTGQQLLNYLACFSTEKDNNKIIIQDLFQGAMQLGMSAKEAKIYATVEFNRFSDD